MKNFSRRDFIKLSGVSVASAGLSAAGVSAARAGGTTTPTTKKSGPKVLVVGGGFGGATCAKYLRKLDPSLSVTVIEPNTKFITCPFSNYVIGGFRKIESITHGYGNLRGHGVAVLHDTVATIDPAGKSVTLKSGRKLTYDRLVVSPGIDFKWDAIAGYSEKASETMPHAWKAGAQTLLLRKKLEAMKSGGTFVMVAPPNPFRCPPGPYERASMVAHYLKQHKPRSKIIILDAKDAFSKQGLFTDGWKNLYGGMIEWVAGSKGGAVKSVDTKTMTVDAFEKIKADVVNVIPAQKAGAIAHQAGLADASGWCPVDPKSFESKIHAGIHVIGDASIAGALPKSGFAANSEAKQCAHAVVAMLKGDAVSEAKFVNTCYSLLSPTYGISVAGVYHIGEKGISEVPGAGGVSPKDADAEFRKKEADYTYGWYASIAADVWG